MYTVQPKKLLIVNILDILRKFTDEDHRLSQREIVDLLKTEYNMEADRKSVKRNLMNLIDFGYDIEYSESVRIIKNPSTGETQESLVLSDFYLVRELTDGELRLLIDSLLFSKHIPYSQCRDLIEKLSGLSSRYFRSRVKHICTLPERSSQNKQLFYTIDTLDIAIEKHKQVSFLYYEYGMDKKLRPRKDSEGKPRKYIVNPYQMAAINGRYYLICNYDKYDGVSHYRLDRIADIRLLDAPAKPMSKVKGLENGFDLSRHMMEHIYMFTGESAAVTFQFQKHLLSEVIDWFGTDIAIFDETEQTLCAKVHINLMAMRKWALQYALYVKILSPRSLALDVKNDLLQAMKNYE